jgi:hypothetical protein
MSEILGCKDIHFLEGNGIEYQSKNTQQQPQIIGSAYQISSLVYHKEKR